MYMFKIIFIYLLKYQCTMNDDAHFVSFIDIIYLQKFVLFALVQNKFLVFALRKLLNYVKS